MKSEKRRIWSAAAVLLFGLAVVLAGGSAGSGGFKGDNAVLPEVSQAAAADAADTEGSGGAVIDFDSLKAQNGDIYAWIRIPGTGVDYPVLQKTDSDDPYDNYYLDHTAELAEGYPGAIYSQAVNATDFMDPVTVLYGHNMKDGSMFGSLHAYEDKDFFDENRKILVYTPDSVLTYEIFAQVNFSDALITYEYDFSDREEVSRYLDDIRACEGNFNEARAVSGDDKILTLSTCYSDQEFNRLLIEAVLVEDGGR